MPLDEYIAHTFPYVADRKRSEIFEDYAPYVRMMYEN